VDTSKQYVKMCDCPEIQGESVTPPYPNDYYARRKHGAIRYGYQLLTSDIIDNDYTWLPRQDQIQEMMGDFDKMLPMLPQLERLDKACGEQFTSMEQLWLAFYMLEKHKKTWDGQEWVAQKKAMPEFKIATQGKPEDA